MSEMEITYRVTLTVHDIRRDSNRLSLTAAVNVEIEDTGRAVTSRMAAIEAATSYFIKLGIGGLITDPDMRVSWSTSLMNR